MSIRVAVAPQAALRAFQATTRCVDFCALPLQKGPAALTFKVQPFAFCCAFCLHLITDATVVGSFAPCETLVSWTFETELRDDTFLRHPFQCGVLLGVHSYKYLLFFPKQCTVRGS